LNTKSSKELHGLEEDVIFGIVYTPPEYTVYSSIDDFSEIENEYLTLQRNYKYIVPDFLFANAFLFLNFVIKPGKIISSKSSVFVSTKHKTSKSFTNS
jgi:hypothetical protein